MAVHWKLKCNFFQWFKSSLKYRKQFRNSSDSHLVRQPLALRGEFVRHKMKMTSQNNQSDSKWEDRSTWSVISNQYRTKRSRFAFYYQIQLFLWRCRSIVLVQLRLSHLTMFLPAPPWRFIFFLFGCCLSRAAIFASCTRACSPWIVNEG